MSTYRCPKCCGTDMRLEVTAVVSLDGEGRTDVEDFDNVCGVEETDPTAHTVCNNPKCEHEGPLAEFTEGAEPLPPVPPLVIEYHYCDGDVGAHPEESAAAALLWRSFSRAASHKPVQIVIRPETAEESTDAAG